MTTEQIQSLNLGIDTTDVKEVLKVESAIEWLADNTTIDVTDLENIPSCAKLFITKFVELQSADINVSSESIGGLSQSFKNESTETLLWNKANELLGSYLKSRVRFVFATKKWKEW